MDNEATLKIGLDMDKKPEKPKYDEWQIKDAVRTLTDSEKIRGDRELMTFVLPELEKQKKAAEIAYAKTLYGFEEEQKVEPKGLRR